MKKLFLFAAVAAMMVGCSETDELALNQAVKQQTEKGGIQFDVYTQRAMTRAGVAGNAEAGQYGITTESLKNGAHKDGFGVFAYYTSNSEFDTNSSIPNFMYNEQVTWNDDKKVWTYEPVKYWPNEFGDAANSDDLDKVSFFAYAPYVDFTVNTGVPVVGEGEDATLIQKKNIVGTVKNTTSGDPYIKYIVDPDPATSVDLLWGVAADKNGYRGLNYTGAMEDENFIPGNCYIDLTKQIGTTDSIKWNFKHALAQLNIQIISAVDIETEGDEIYKPEEVEGGAKEYGTMADGDVDDMTKVYLRWIEFGGFVMKGALNLHSEDVETPGVQYAEPNWKGFDGTNELVIEPVRFNDGLKDGKEGTTNNLQKNELPVALNDTIIECSAEAEDAASWEEKHAGIPTEAYCNLFKSSGENVKASDPIYVIPTGEELTIEMLYDVMTKDEKLAGLLSDNKTHGSAVENKISKETGVMIEAGKSYVIKIVVGLESVKFSVEVTPWQDAEPKETDVDLPFNPGYAQVRAGEGDNQLPFGAVYYLYKDTENPEDFVVPTLFTKTFVTKVTREIVEVDPDYKDYFYFGENFEYRVAIEGFADKINQNPEDPEAEVEYVGVTVQEFDEKEGKYVDQDEEVYFFSEKLAVPTEPAGSGDDDDDDDDDDDAVAAGQKYEGTQGQDAIEITIDKVENGYVYFTRKKDGNTSATWRVEEENFSVGSTFSPWYQAGKQWKQFNWTITVGNLIPQN